MSLGGVISSREIINASRKGGFIFKEATAEEIPAVKKGKVNYTLDRFRRPKITQLEGR